jgi:hypothetical protein
MLWRPCVSSSCNALKGSNTTTGKFRVAEGRDRSHGCYSNGQTLLNPLLILCHYKGLHSVPRLHHLWYRVRSHTNLAAPTSMHKHLKLVKLPARMLCRYNLAHHLTQVPPGRHFHLNRRLLRILPRSTSHLASVSRCRPSTSKSHEIPCSLQACTIQCYR